MASVIDRWVLTYGLALIDLARQEKGRNLDPPRLPAPEDMMDKLSIEVVAERLERLERQCRRWRWTGIAAVLALAVALTAFAARRNQVPSEIRAKNLWVLDEHGRGLIRIGSSIREKGNGVIEFLDESGQPRMALGLANSHNPFVWLSGRDGRDELVMDAGNERGMGITLKDLKRDSGLSLAPSPDGIAGLAFMSSGGKPVLDLGVTPAGSASFAIRDTDGKELFRLPTP
ncbi:MAG: hypothetical protein ACHRXM_11440 [Isosphaerales bacterium]